MARPVTLFTGQWADLTLEELAEKASGWGYDGLELACWGDHFEVDKALADDSYCQGRHDLLAKYGLKVWSISNHLVGQAVCDNIDSRHQGILSETIWGDGDPAGVQERAADEMKKHRPRCRKTRRERRQRFHWQLYMASSLLFPPRTIQGKLMPVLKILRTVGTRFLMSLMKSVSSSDSKSIRLKSPFDIVTAERAIEAVNGREAFGFNYDPSHLGYQGVDYVAFLERLSDRIYHVHMKDVWWADTPRLSGVFGGHLNFGDARRNWDFRSIGRGNINFEEIIRALEQYGI